MEKLDDDEGSSSSDVEEEEEVEFNDVFNLFFHYVIIVINLFHLYLSFELIIYSNE